MCKETRVVTTREWKATHNPHGEAAKLLSEHQPPARTYRLYELVCPCGARHVVLEEAEATKRD